MGEPATTARRRGGQERAPGSESGRFKPTIACVEYCTDLGGKFWILDGVAPVALDEGNDDVLATQRRQQICARRVAKRIRTGVRGNSLPILKRHTHRAVTVPEVDG